MANILGGLQGLVGGLSQGLGQWNSARQQAMENEQRARQLSAQERQVKLAEQAEEFNQRKAQYEALMGPLDQATIEPFVQSGFKFNKNEDGTFSRPLSAQEQTQLANANIENLRAKEATLGLEARERLRQNPQMWDTGYDAMRQYFIANALNPADIPEPLSYIRQKAEAEAAPQLEGQIKLQGLRDAADMARTRMTTDASKYSADRMYARVLDSAQQKPLDPKKFADWKTTYFATNPQARQTYNEAVRTNGAAQAEAWLVEAYEQLFKQ